MIEQVNGDTLDMTTTCEKQRPGSRKPAQAFSACLALILLMSLVSCGSEKPFSNPSMKVALEDRKAEDTSEKIETPEAQPASRLGSSTAESDNLPASLAANALNVKAVSIEPAVPVSGDPLRANVLFNENSPPTTSIYYRWKVNDQVVQESPSPELQRPIARGDRIEVMVFVGDAREESRAVRGYTTIGNSPPSIQKAEERLDEKGEYLARFQPGDKDGEPVTLSLQRGPEGMTLDTSKALVHWAVPKGAKGSFPVEVLASDASGAQVLFAYTITIRQE